NDVLRRVRFGCGLDVDCDLLPHSCKDIIVVHITDAALAWRILKSMYACVESYVRVGGVDSQPFTSQLGVRQGSVLSPLLYSIFINDLASSLSALGIGVQLGGDTIPCLLFADDILLLAE